MQFTSRSDNQNQLENKKNICRLPSSVVWVRGCLRWHYVKICFRLAVTVERKTDDWSKEHFSSHRETVVTQAFAFVFVCVDGLRIAPLFGHFHSDAGAYHFRRAMCVQHTNDSMPTNTLTDWHCNCFCPSKKARRNGSLVFVVCVPSTTYFIIVDCCYDFFVCCSDESAFCDCWRQSIVRTFATIIFDCFLFVTFECTTSRHSNNNSHLATSIHCACVFVCFREDLVRAEAVFWSQSRSIFVFHFPLCA